MRRGLVEAEILERSAELFAARGFAGTSVQDIADALGSSRPALYHYFSSKDEILVRLTEGLLDSTDAAVDVALASSGPADKQLERLVKALIIPIAESPGRFRLMLTHDGAVSTDAQDRLRILERKVIRSMEAVIAAGVTSGRFRRCDERAATFAVLGMINWVAWWYSPGGDLSVEDLSASITEQAVASLRNRESAAGADTPAEIIATIRRDLTALERITHTD